MANDEIFYVDLTKDYLDRYDLAKYTNFSDTNILINSYFLYRLRQLRIVKYYKLSVERYRAETLAFLNYNGLESLWWMILYYNDITNWRDLKPPLTLKLFALSDLDNLILEISSKQLIKDKQDLALGSF